jgi:hypothetical protein
MLYFEYKNRKELLQQKINSKGEQQKIHKFFNITRKSNVKRVIMLLK